MVLLDVLLGLSIWEAAYLVQVVWGHGPLSYFAVAAVVPSVAVWIGIHALLGLYPGYGLDRVEELRRRTYAVLATVAITATFAVPFRPGICSPVCT